VLCSTATVRSRRKQPLEVKIPSAFLVKPTPGILRPWSKHANGPRAAEYYSITRRKQKRCSCLFYQEKSAQLQLLGGKKSAVFSPTGGASPASKIRGQLARLCMARVQISNSKNMGAETQGHAAAIFPLQAPRTLHTQELVFP